MVQGLGFLSKKSWHTKNLSNQKRVWEEEQKQAAEASKTKELAKQIQQEREQEELDRIAGKRTVMDRGIDWMYQGGTQGDLAKEDAEKKAEEYLLGKEFVGEGAVQGDFDAGDQKEGINNVLKAPVPDQGDLKPAAAASAPVGYTEPSVHDRNENFRLRNEDPMFFVSQKVREKEKRRDDTKELYERVIGVPGSDKDEASDDDSRGKRKSRKERKQQKRRRKKSSRRHRDDSDDESRRRSHKKHHKRHRSCSRSRSRSRSLSSDRYDRHHDHQRHGKRDDRGYDLRSDDSYDDSRRNSGRNRPEENRRRYKDDDRSSRRQEDRANAVYDDRRDRNHHHRHHHHHHHKHSSCKSELETKKIEGYGLKGAPVSKIDRSNLGPDSELLRQKRETRENEKRRNAETSQARKRSSKEERKRALEEMQEDARKREERKGQHASHLRSDNLDDENAGRGVSASFLNDLTKQTHGIAGKESLSSRVAQNRHTNQRLNDSFL